MRKIFLPVAAVLLFSSCGDEPDPVCTESIQALCEKACGCSDSCRIRTGGGSPGFTVTATAGYGSLEQCVAMNSQICEPDFEYPPREIASCKEDLATTACESDPPDESEPSPEPFILVPKSCGATVD